MYIVHYTMYMLQHTHMLLGLLHNAHHAFYNAQLCSLQYSMCDARRNFRTPAHLYATIARASDIVNMFNIVQCTCIHAHYTIYLYNVHAYMHIIQYTCIMYIIVVPVQCTCILVLLYIALYNILV